MTRTTVVVAAASTRVKPINSTAAAPHPRSSLAVLRATARAEAIEIFSLFFVSGSMLGFIFPFFLFLIGG